MEVLTLQVFVSLLLVVGSLVLFAVSSRQRDHDHADRLALLPLAEDDQPSTPPSTSPLPSPIALPAQPADSPRAIALPLEARLPRKEPVR